MTVLRYIAKRNIKQHIRLLLLVIAGVLVGLGPIHLLRALFDRAIPTGDLSLLGLLAVELIALVIAGAVVNYHLTVTADKIREDFMADIRADLFAHLLRVAPDFYARQSIGQILSRLHVGIDRLGMSVALIFTDPIVHLSTFLIYVSYLISLNWRMAILSVIVLPFVALAVPHINRRISETQKRWDAHMTGILANMQESFSGIFEVQAHATFKYEAERFRSRLLRFIKPNMDRSRYYALLAALSNLSRGIGPALVYIYGAYLAIGNRMLVGEIIAFVTTLGVLYASVDRLINYPPLLRNAEDRFAELREYFEQPQIFIDSALSGAADSAKTIQEENAVSLDRVGFGYDRSRPVINSVSLDIRTGEHVVFVGPSGCGKSTVLGLLSGRLHPQSGEVQIGGESLDKFSIAARAAEIGYVGQFPFLFNSSLRDNLLYALYRSDSGSPDAPLSYIDLAPLKLSDSYDTSAIDEILMEICSDVGFGDELFEFGLEARLPAAKAGPLLEIRLILGPELAGESSLERFDPNAYLSRAAVGENLAFAPYEEAGSSADARLMQWIEAARKPDVAMIDLLVKVGWKDVSQDLDYLTRIASESPALLAEFGISKEDLDGRIKIAERARGNELTERGIGSETYNALARRGLLAYESDPENRMRIVSARSAFGKALGRRAPAQYNPSEWHDALTVRENLLFGRADSDNVSANRRINAKLRSAIERASFMDKVLRAGLDFEAGERGSRLSGGQRQKISIARTLLKQAPILLLDEATASLDQSSAQTIHRLISERYRGRTVIAVTHQLSLLEHFDRIVVFDKGKIAEQGTEAELLAKGGLFYRLHNASAMVN